MINIGDCNVELSRFEILENILNLEEGS